jgi:hypothetical protein
MPERLVRRLTLAILPMWAGLCLCLALLAILGLWQRVAQYPHVTVRGTLGGLRVTVTALGQCLTFDHHFITGDSAREVHDWHKQRGWAEFVPLIPQQRFGPFALGRFVYIDGSSVGTLVFQRQAYCVYMN